MRIDRVVTQLREAGYRVRVYHERATHEDVEAALDARSAGDKLAFPLMVNKTTLPPSAISPYGGKTIAVISRGEGDDETELVRGVAVCSPLDPFNRRVGASKALGRAISKLRTIDSGPDANVLAINTGKKG